MVYRTALDYYIVQLFRRLHREIHRCHRTYPRAPLDAYITATAQLLDDLKAYRDGTVPARDRSTTPSA